MEWGVCIRAGAVCQMDRREFTRFGERWEICHLCREIYVYEDSTRHDMRRICNVDSDELTMRATLMSAYQITTMTLQPSRVHPGCPCYSCIILSREPYKGLPPFPNGLFIFLFLFSNCHCVLSRIVSRLIFSFLFH